MSGKPLQSHLAHSLTLIECGWFQTHSVISFPRNIFKHASAQLPKVMDQESGSASPRMQPQVTASLKQGYTGAR